MDTSRDRNRACGFCDGSGVWFEQDGDADGADPCPLCEGTGTAPADARASTEDPAEAVTTLARLLAVLPRLTQAERQRLYEELHALYDCRIYKV